MKKLPVLVMVTALFFFLTIGIFLGRNLRSNPVVVSIPAEIPVIPDETTAPSPFPIDLNRATREELETLPGIGETLAFRIWAYRQEFGRFISLEDLKKVEGVTDTTLRKIQEYVYIGGTK